MLGLYKTWFKYSLVISFLGGENSLASQKKLTKIKMKFALWAACKVTAVSQHLIDDFEKKFAFFDTLHIPFFNDPAETLKTNILLPDVVESGHFVFCGRISPEKRVPFLIETFKEAVIQGCSKKLYIVGEGNDLFRCRQFVEQNNLQKQIIFLGQLPYCIAQKVISVCCCLILCSRTESNPQVVLEAMSLKKPVICSFIPGVEKIVIHEETGLLFLQDRKDLFVESILKISNNEHYAQNLGASAHVLFRKLFSQHDYTEKMLDIYHAVGHNHF